MGHDGRMPETAQEWYARVRASLDAEGYRDVDPTEWPSFPFVEGGVRPMGPPSEERTREGAGGVDCVLCERSRAEDPRDYVFWRDELMMLGAPFQTSGLPLVCYLMPRRHADLRDLTDREARRTGELLVFLERAACDVLDVPRIQVARYGEGVEHLHYWVFARPTGIARLRGSFLTLWDEVLPHTDVASRRADLDLLAARLVQLAGGQALPSR